MEMENKKTKFPPLLKLNNGILVPTKELIIAIHDDIIENRKKFGKEDPIALRDGGLIQHLCDMLIDRPHKYKNNLLLDTLYVATETFYYIACQHPFIEANKSTGYISALTVIRANRMLSVFRLAPNAQVTVEIKGMYDAPDEAKEITKLAEAGVQDHELKKLIKEFLQKHI